MGMRHVEVPARIEIIGVLLLAIALVVVTVRFPNEPSDLSPITAFYFILPIDI